MEAKFKNKLPQEGTSSTGAGESLPEPSSGCPTFSGGGRILRSYDKKTTLASVQRTTDLPIDTTTTPVVRIERDCSLDRFTVSHWSDGSSGSATLPAAVKRSHGQDKAGADGADVTPSKMTTARRGKSRDPGSSAGVTRAVVTGEAGGTQDRPNDEPICSVTPSDVADVNVLDGIELLDPASLRALAKENVDTILEVAKKSGHLKGTFIKKLKEAAWILQEVTATALTRTVAEETLVLRRETRKLRQEVEDLKAELASLRCRGEAPSAPPSSQVQSGLGQGQDSLPQAIVDAIGVHMEGMERSLRVSLGEVVTARIEALDDRLLPAKVVRPPLAADRKKTCGPPASKPTGRRVTDRKTAASKPAATAPAPSSTGVATADHSQNPLGMEWANLGTAVPGPASAMPSAPEWTTVTRRRRKGKRSSVVPTATAGVAPAPLGRAPGRKPKAKFPSTPRSAAVVVTLQPEALARGLSYREALLKARDQVTLAGLGIEDISLRPSATGARIIEVRGSRGSEQADQLAEHLRLALSDMATVARPIKRANVRVVGLDDTVSVEEVVVAAATKGCCDPALIRAGAIRTYGRGMGAVHLSLPVAAAKALVKARRLLVGWSASRVRLLAGGPMRCFKCMGVGHTRPLCPSTVERGSLYFRCGLPGHKALQCEATKPHCAVCADTGRPAGHHMGGAGCRPPPNRERAPPLPMSSIEDSVDVG